MAVPKTTKQATSRRRVREGKAIVRKQRIRRQRKK